MNEPIFPIEDSIGFLLGRAYAVTKNHVTQQFAEIGTSITMEQWKILMRLWQKDGRTQQDLAAATFKDKTSITRLLSTMEKHNIILRIVDKEDRRHKRIYLTQKGKELKTVLLPIAFNALLKATNNIDPAKLETCKEVLKQIFENITETD